MRIELLDSISIGGERWVIDVVSVIGTTHEAYLDVKPARQTAYPCQLNRFDFLASGNDESVINPRLILGRRRVLRNLAAP